MKRLICIIISMLFISTTNAAPAPMPVPHGPLYVKQHWISMTNSYDVETKTQKLGTLYRRFLSLLLKYDFYDAFNNKIATAKSKFFSFNAHFDIYDNQEQFLGAADESLFSFFPTFWVYGQDGISKLAKAKMNFWGTTFYLYDPVTDQEMAQLYRPFFRLKNNWTFEVTNQMLFDSKNIDKRVLLTIIAFQSDREYWESQRRRDDNYRYFSNAQSEEFDTQPAVAKINKMLDPQFKADPEALNTISKKVESAYATHNNKNAMTTRNQQVQDYIDFSLKFANAPEQSTQDKKNILYLLKMRLLNAGQ